MDECILVDFLLHQLFLEIPESRLSGINRVKPRRLLEMSDLAPGLIQHLVLYRDGASWRYFVQWICRLPITQGSRMNIAKQGFTNRHPKTYKYMQPGTKHPLWIINIHKSLQNISNRCLISIC